MATVPQYQLKNTVPSYMTGPVGGDPGGGFGSTTPGQGPTSTAGGPGGDPTAVAPTPDTATGSSDSSWLSNLGSELSTFFSSPFGKLAEFGVLAGLGLSQADAQKKTNDQLAGSLSTLGQPFSQAGAAELGQITGGKPMGGPMGASVAQQTDAAKNLGQVAKDYSTGKLTAPQNQEVQDFIKQQRAMVDTQLAQSGNTDGSARQAAYQQIDNNAAKLSEQLTQANVGIATQALQGVQSTYSTLLQQALSSAEFGLGAQEAAVMTQIQADTALAASLNQLFGQIAQGFGTAMSGGKGGSSGGSAGNDLLKQGESALKNYLSSGSAGAGADLGISAIDQAGLSTSMTAGTVAAEGGVAADVAAGNDLWLSSMGSDAFSGVGAAGGAGAAAGGGAAAAGAGAGVGTAAAADLGSAALLPSTEAAFAGGGAEAAGAGAGATFAEFAGPLALAGIAAYGLTKKSDPTKVERVGPGQSQVGISAQGKGATSSGLKQGNMALGAGGSGTTGANNFFVVDPTTGKQTWVGKDVNTTLRDIGSAINPTNLAQITYNPKATYRAGSGIDLNKPTRGTANLPYDGGGWNGSTASAAEASDIMSGAYNKLGGQKVLGDFKTWLSSLSGLMRNIGM